ncbi:unnamed protein product [Adineta steineri]|uniref:Alpha/beta hydrolase fold-3 domain-containing protein n=1 Tax=Adineta steineri TaxID=433720 RepID=A0A814PYF3_9BILA|nr:unnamed protein product [Adineta steineri]CAF3910928.1 unnamed protein product [Adineta steineri]
MNNEARAYLEFLASGILSPRSSAVEKMRERSEELHLKINQELIGTFTGVEEEKIVKIDNAGADKATKIGVAGESSGAMIAASLCHTLNNIDFQILVCGEFDLAGQGASRKEFAKPMYGIKPEVTKWMHETAFRDADDLMDPRASVLLNKSFDGLPPSLFVVCELDPLRDDSYAYQEALDKAGVKTKLTLLDGMIHAFFSSPGIYRNASEQMINAVQEFMASL